MNASRNKGFTLIELLVVVSIIGMLSSVILVALQGARTKGTIGAGQLLDENIYHTSGDQIAADWEFNDGSGSSAVDTSGNGNTGTLMGSPTWQAGVSPLGGGYSLLFHGTPSTDYVSVPYQSSLNLGTQGMTVSAWVYPTADPATSMGLVVQREGCLGQPTFNWQLYGSDGGGKVFFTVIKYNSALNSYAPVALTSSAHLPANQWSFVAATFDPAAQLIKIYFNGSLNSTADTSGTIGTINQQARAVQIGWDSCGTDYFKGNIDEVRLYKSALTASNVQNIYAEGVAKHYADASKAQP